MPGGESVAGPLRERLPSLGVDNTAAIQRETVGCRHSLESAPTVKEPFYSVPDKTVSGRSIEAVGWQPGRESVLSAEEPSS